jgi:hypothetical protein
MLERAGNLNNVTGVIAIERDVVIGLGGIAAEWDDSGAALNFAGKHLARAMQRQPLFGGDR